MVSYATDDAQPARSDGPPTTERPTRGPGRALQLGELFGFTEAARLLRRSGALRTRPMAPQPLTVVDIPGWLAPEASMVPLRSYLRRLGHDARGWGFGANTMDPGEARDQMLSQVDRLVDEAGKPIALLGWSLGGFVAREVARLRPAEVATVVTFGSPIIGGPKFTSAARRTPPEEQARIVQEIAKAEAVGPIRCPVTVIYSRRDGVVDWRAQLDHETPGAVHREVRSTHLGLGLDPDVWEAVADGLERATPRAGELHV